MWLLPTVDIFIHIAGYLVILILYLGQRSFKDEFLMKCILYTLIQNTLHLTKNSVQEFLHKGGLQHQLVLHESHHKKLEYHKTISNLLQVNCLNHFHINVCPEEKSCGPIPGSCLWSKKWKNFWLLNGYRSWCKHAVNKVLIDNIASCWSLLSQDIWLQSKNPWCVMEFWIEQDTDDEQHINKQIHVLRMKFYRQDFFWCNILFGQVCDTLV